MEEKRDLARELAREHYAAGDPLGWFDALYRAAGRDFGTVPWADREVNPHLAAWCEREGLPQAGQRLSRRRLSCGSQTNRQARWPICRSPPGTTVGGW